MWQEICVILLLVVLGKMKTLSRQVKKGNQREGKQNMSELLKECIGQKCLVELDSWFEVANTYDILGVDGEWVKLSRTKTKGDKEIKLVRIDNIQSITLKD